jgi:hypothetical protein
MNASHKEDIVQNMCKLCPNQNIDFDSVKFWFDFLNVLNIYNVTVSVSMQHNIYYVVRDKERRNII